MPKTPRPIRRRRRPARPAAGNIGAEAFLADALVDAGLPRPKLGHKFHRRRKWQADLYYDVASLIIEVDGNTHCRTAQYRKDRERDNAAIAAGYRVLRYPASSVFTKKRLPRIVEQIKRVLCGVQSPADDAAVLTGD